MSHLILRTALLFIVAVLWADAVAAPRLSAQTSTQSAVTVKVTPRNLQGNAWEFDVVFDTHTQELKDDLLKTAVLVTADGTLVAPTAWQGDPPNGHHRKGVLRFDALTPAPQNVELRINRAGEPKPRSFRWQLQ
jgi:hypothetical protein